VGEKSGGAEAVWYAFEVSSLVLSVIPIFGIVAVFGAFRGKV
jgi:hypothetical protein